MKFGLAYGSFCIGDPKNALNFSDLWSSSRGLTGSELSYIRIAQELKKLGHDITLFTVINPNDPSHELDGIQVKSLNEIHQNERFDAFCSWNETSPLINVHHNVLRLVNLQINSIDQCHSNFDDCVDVWLSPSNSHRERMLRDSHEYYENGVKKLYRWNDGRKWDVLTNGVDLDIYDGFKKVPGRVIWASSPDRGLHWILQCWPRIKKNVPHAHLKIFYKLYPWLESMDSVGYNFPSMNEQVRRAAHIRECLRRLNGYGIEIIGSVSRDRITKEMAEAEALAYSCDTVNWTEGFSVTTMEACAARVVPVVSCVDALESIYGSLDSSVKAPISDNLDDFVNKIILSLTDEKYRNDVTTKAKELAKNYQWPDIAKKFVDIVERRIK